MRDLLARALGRAWRAWPVAVLVAGGTLPIARVLADPLHRLPGGARTDVYKHVWSYWHTLRTLGDGWPWTPYLNAPGGGYLLDVMLVPSLLLAPVTWLLGVAAAANLWVWLSLVATGLSTWALCREVTGSDLGGVVGGLLAQTAPYLLAYPLYSGVHERLSVWAFPLVLLGLLRLRAGRSWGWIPVLVGVFALTSAGCAIHGYIAGLVCLLAAPLFVPLPVDGRSWRDGWRPALRAGLGVALTLGCFVLVLHLDFRWYQWGSYHPWTLSYQGDWIQKWHGLPQRDTLATLPALLLPEAVRYTTASLTNDELYRICFLGQVPLGAALAGLLAARRHQRFRVAWIVLVGLFLSFLALGPSFEWRGRFYSSPPFVWLAGVLPYFGVRVTHWQLVAAFAPLSAVGVAALVGRPDRRWLRVLIALGVLVAATAERVRALPFPLLLPAASARVSPIYDAVLPDGGLVEVPRFWRGTELTPGILFLAQTVHERPIPITVNINQTVWDNVPLLRDGISGAWPMVAMALRRSGFRWIVVHRSWFLRPGPADTCLRTLRMLLGPPVAETEDEALFDLSVLPVEPDPTLVWPPGHFPSEMGKMPAGSVGW